MKILINYLENKQKYKLSLLSTNQNLFNQEIVIEYIF